MTAVWALGGTARSVERQHVLLPLGGQDIHSTTLSTRHMLDTESRLRLNVASDSDSGLPTFLAARHYSSRGSRPSVHADHRHG